MNMPFSSQIAIDYMINAPCNLKCPFCYGPNPKMRGELKLQQKITLAKNLKSNNIERIVIAGGEPLLCKDMYGFCEFAHSIGLNLGLQTNAFFKDKLEAILPFLDWVAFPLDGISPAAQLKMRTSDEHLKFFLEALELVKAYRLKNATGSPKIKVGTVLSKYNITEVGEMAKIISSNDISVWKWYKLRERGKATEIFDEFSVSDDIVKNLFKEIKSQFPSLNIYYSTDNVVTDSYVIIDPDSSTYVIKGRGQQQFGRLITETGAFDAGVWAAITAFTDFKAMAGNIQQSFPNWNPQ